MQIKPRHKMSSQGKNQDLWQNFKYINFLRLIISLFKIKPIQNFGVIISNSTCVVFLYESCSLFIFKTYMLIIINSSFICSYNPQYDIIRAPYNQISTCTSSLYVRIMINVLQTVFRKLQHREFSSSCIRIEFNIYQIFLAKFK